MHHVLKFAAEAEQQEQMEAARAQQGRVAASIGKVGAPDAVIVSRSSDRGRDHNRRDG